MSRSKFNRRYQLLDCIGKGGYGQVHNARRKVDNSLVVMKSLPRDRILNWGTLEAVGFLEMNQTFLEIISFYQNDILFRNKFPTKSKFYGVCVVFKESFKF